MVKLSSTHCQILLHHSDFTQKNGNAFGKHLFYKEINERNEWRTHIKAPENCLLYNKHQKETSVI